MGGRKGNPRRRRVQHGALRGIYDRVARGAVPRTDGGGRSRAGSAALEALGDRVCRSARNRRDAGEGWSQRGAARAARAVARGRSAGMADRGRAGSSPSNGCAPCRLFRSGAAVVFRAAFARECVLQRVGGVAARRKAGSRRSGADVAGAVAKTGVIEDELRGGGRPAEAEGRVGSGAFAVAGGSEGIVEGGAGGASSRVDEGGGGETVRLEPSAVVASGPAAPERGGARPGGHGAPHHRGRLVWGGVAEGDGGGLRGVRGGEGVAASGARGSVRGLCGVAAGEDERAVGSRGVGVLEAGAGRRASGAGASRGPSSGGGTKERKRRDGEIRDPVGIAGEASGASSERRNDAVHDAAGGVPGAAAPLHGGRGHPGGHGAGGSEPRGAGGGGGVLREQRDPEDGRIGEPDVPGAAGPSEAGMPGSVGAPGGSVRPSGVGGGSFEERDGRDADAGVVHAARRGDEASRDGRGAGVAGGDRAERRVRSDTVGMAGAGRTDGSVEVRPGSIRCGDDSADGGALREGSGRGGEGAGSPSGGDRGPDGRGASGGPGRVERHSRGDRGWGVHPREVRGVGGEERGVDSGEAVEGDERGGERVRAELWGTGEAGEPACAVPEEEGSESGDAGGSVRGSFAGAWGGPSGDSEERRSVRSAGREPTEGAVEEDPFELGGGGGGDAG